MPTPVTNISGIGPHTAKILKEHGYASAEDIASTTAGKLSEVPGFGLSRSKVVIAAAKDLFSGTEQVVESDTKKTLLKAKKKSKKGKTKAKGKKLKSSKKKKEKPKKEKGSKDKKKKGNKSKKKKKK